MTRGPTLYVLLVVLVQTQQQVLTGRQVIQAGGVFRQSCSFSVPYPDRYIIQFYISKTEVKMFNARTYSKEFRLVSNGTTILPTIANYTDRYNIDEDNGIFSLVINNVADSDSAWYGCFKFDLVRNEPKASQGSIELLVPGPFEGIFWTGNFSGRLSLKEARQNEIPDGDVVQPEESAFRSKVACILLVSNMEPTVHITIGHFGEPGSVDITHQFNTMVASVTRYNSGGTSYRATVFFVKRFRFTQSRSNVFCRAAVLGKTYETSVNIQIKTKPTIGACDPISFTAPVGSKNVTLTCLIMAHPEPYVEWMLPSGMKINALSNNPNYTVTNEPRVEGVFTTLTVSEVCEDDAAFGWVEINATNTEGSGGRYLEFTQAVGVAGTAKTSGGLIIMTTWLLVWMVKQEE